MISTETFAAATSSVLGHYGTEVVADARRTVPPVSKFQGTGLPVGGPAFRTLDRTRLPLAGIGARVCVLDGGNGTAADQVIETGVRMPAAVDPGIPPRRTPSRC